jgi:hypothetical protein
MGRRRLLDQRVGEVHADRLAVAAVRAAVGLAAAALTVAAPGLGVQHSRDGGRRHVRIRDQCGLRLPESRVRDRLGVPPGRAQVEPVEPEQLHPGLGRVALGPLAGRGRRYRGNGRGDNAGDAERDDTDGQRSGGRHGSSSPKIAAVSRGYGTAQRQSIERVARHQCDNPLG